VESNGRRNLVKWKMTAIRSDDEEDDSENDNADEDDNDTILMTTANMTTRATRKAMVAARSYERM